MTSAHVLPQGFKMGLVPFLLLLLAIACQPIQERHDRAFVDKLRAGNLTLRSEPIELTSEDGLALIDAHQANASVFKVKGVGLQSSMEEVVTAWGNPDKIDPFPEVDTINLIYNNKQTNETAVTFNIVRNSVQRVVFREGADFLVGKSRVNMSKDNIITRFGKPDKEEMTTLMSMYYYYPEGLELYHRRQIVRGWGFVQPQSPREVVYNVTARPIKGSLPMNGD
ncbi:hypothetical protein HY641_02925 [Candidatus Woesearchaeota archaeon]|nr:hypothetical protein [Candidatus Woesearchaeota archaeon]